MEVNGNKILTNIKIWWMSMLDPLKKIMEKYKSLLTIIQTNQNSIQMAKVNETPHVQIVFYDFQFFESC